MPDPQPKPKPKPPTWWQMLRGLPEAPPVATGPLQPAAGVPATPIDKLVDFVRGATVGGEWTGDSPYAYAGEAAGLLPLGALGRGLYSRVDDALKLLPAKGAHPNKIAGILKSNASAEELTLRKVPEFLASKGNATVTPSELQAHLAQHPAPIPKVKTLGATEEGDVLAQQWQASMNETNHAWHQWQEARVMGATPEVEAAARARWQASNAETNRLHQGWETASPKAFEAKYAQYQLPGGESYRETLLTLPEASVAGALEREAALQAELTALQPELHAAHRADSPAYDALSARRDALTRELAETKSTRRATQESSFRSGHFDEPNLVVHTRSNVRTLPTGERGRFVEEVQSDWHQKGKKEGYRSPASDQPPQLRATPRDGYWEVNTDQGDFVTNVYGSDAATAEAAVAEAQQRLHRQPMRTATDPRVPDAPFKESWPDLGLKQQLLEAAADPEASWLGFTSGQTQAARYDLSKQISRVEFDAGDRQLRAFDHNGQEVISQTTGPETLPDYIGKEAAEKLLASTPSLHPDDQTPLYSLTGVDLQVGGEGMHHFYDDLLPKRLQKIVQRFGGKVERSPVKAGIDATKISDRQLAEAVFDALPEQRIQGRLPVGRGRTLYSREDLGDAFVSGRLNITDFPPALQQRIETAGMQEPAWIVRLTPEMKQRILKEGLPLMTPLIGGVALSQLARPSQPEQH